MRYPIAFFLLTPTLALADPGTHLHPHGIDAIWLFVVGLIALTGGYLAGRRRR
ncbi:LPXTG-motif cell wall anchor domain-containing protein [Roseovarius azorensis]|uniref:LPXTG-motif cell wall anchor domain-containing protein n=1 Tax=Roseovarius azorensis TaxID=1287727 RepID=A0A1H7QCG6_9RHOB|nr:LPXTG cell wall anchor domain-containing protein [Roseovarius azorensis]SEL45790.1 LPXTG-motif cell wall anchor domain-containing protein [Roseovarius azorensis]